MVSPRVLKLAEDIKVIAAEMLKRRIKDPRLGFVTITDVRLTGDSRDAQRVLHRVRDAGGAGQHGGCAALGDRDDPVAGGQAARAEVHPDAGVHARCRAGEGAADRGPAGRGQGRRREGGRAGRRRRRTPASRTRTSGPRTTSPTTPTSAPECPAESGVLVVDKPAGWTSHQVVGRAPAAARHPQGRARRHPGPDGHRGAGARGRPGHPAAGSARADRQGVRGHRPAGPGDRHRRRRG